jgi:hypothetical protein
LLARGAELVGEVESYEDNYRLYYPEGTIIELPEQIGLKAQAAAEGTTQRPRLHRQQIGGALTEQSGRNQPQSLAKTTSAKTAQLPCDRSPIQLPPVASTFAW